jgi:hypothetical protein
MRDAFWSAIRIGILVATALSPFGAVAQEASRVRLLDELSRPVVVTDEAGNEVVVDEDVEQASMLWQQPPALQPNQPTTTPARSTTSGTRRSGVRLASTPNMFGDCGPTTINATIITAAGTLTAAEIMLPVVGGARSAKMAENDIAMPVDRVFFNYNHYTDAFQMREQQLIPPGPLLFRQEPIDRYTLGAEKTFYDGLTSVEVRMPFNGAFDANLVTTSVSNGNIGNMAVILKGLLYQGDNLGIGAGLGIDTPTGSDTITRLDTVNLRYQNQAVHLLPWLGFLYSPGDPQWGWGDGFFATGFLQVDVAANGNTVKLVDPGAATTTNLGKYNEQTVLYADLGLGYWLYRDPDAPRWTGLAVVGEAHYTTSLQDADLVAGLAGLTGAVVTNASNRFDVVNGTIAIQALMFDASSLRVGGVFPMGSRQDQRFFDSEVQVQFNRRF